MVHNEERREEASQYTLYSRPSGNIPAMETNFLTFLRTSSIPVSGEIRLPLIVVVLLGWRKLRWCRL